MELSIEGVELDSLHLCCSAAWGEVYAPRQVFQAFLLHCVKVGGVFLGTVGNGPVSGGAAESGRPMQTFHSDQFVLPLPPGHRFPMPKYRLLRERIEGDPAFRLREAPPASEGELALAHDPAYIAAVFEGTLSPVLQRE